MNAANAADAGADEVEGGRCGEDAVHGGDDLAHPMGAGYGMDQINGLAVAVVSISFVLHG